MESTAPMTTASNEEVDHLILSFATARFKVAMIFAEVLSYFRQHEIETTDEELEDRLRVLVDTQAIAMTRSVLDDRENVSALGYSEEPCLYAVIAHQDETELPNGGPTWSHDGMALRWMTDLDKQDFEKLKSYDNLPLPLGAMYIDLHFD